SHVDGEAAVLMLAAESEGDPLGGRAGGGSPAGRGRRLDDPDWLVIGAALDACTRGGPVSERSSKRRSVNDTAPRPPGPAVMAISMAPRSRMAPPPAGPHANETSQLRVPRRCHASRNSKPSPCHHPTSPPLG